MITQPSFLLNLAYFTVNSLQTNNCYCIGTIIFLNKTMKRWKVNGFHTNYKSIINSQYIQINSTKILWIDVNWFAKIN